MTVDSPLTTVQRLLGSSPVGGSPVAPRLPGAKARILETADRLFYHEGIRVVGVDRLIAEASVTKATFYKHYGAKDSLVVAYVIGRHDADVADFERLTGGSVDARASVLALADGLSIRLQRPDYRGSAYANAAAEFSDPTHPVRQAIADHRDWLTASLVDLLKRAGHPMPGDAADDLVTVVDGAAVGAYTGDAIAATASLRRSIERVLEHSA
ncbi:TetR/AcrR family transcriptional regulator [Frigoribacterium sp. 2-23]|uniref:TetR/AcrR family transcriptional regulator n=1 Tax=Frigoribacterium sp. 2-23 TaxID=3415006 RepID=UPI003C6EB13A